MACSKEDDSIAHTVSHEFGDPHADFDPVPTGIVDEPAIRTHGSWIRTLMDALEVSIHTILYERGVYPKEIFIAGRMYDTLAMQCRVKEVSEYVRHCVDAVGEQLAAGAISSFSVTILHSPTQHALERYLFSFSSFPTASTHPPQPNPYSLLIHDDAHPPPDPATIAATQSRNPLTVDPLTAPLPGTQLADLQQQFRAMLNQLGVVSGKLDPLPDPRELTWVVMAEVEEGGGGLRGGMREKEKWVVGEKRERDEAERRKRGDAGGGVRGQVVRNVRSGALGMEVWVEESKVKGKMNGKGKGKERTR